MGSFFFRVCIMQRSPSVQTQPPFCYKIVMGGLSCDAAESFACVEFSFKVCSKMVLCYYLTIVGWGSITIVIKFLMEGLSKITEVES